MLTSVVIAAIYLAGIVALLAAWSPMARAFLRQDKQAGVNWWQNPGLMNLPIYGLAILALLATKAWAMSGKRRVASMLPALGLLGLMYAAIFTTALSVV